MHTTVRTGIIFQTTLSRPRSDRCFFIKAERSGSPGWVGVGVALDRDATVHEQPRQHEQYESDSTV